MEVSEIEKQMLNLVSNMDEEFKNKMGNIVDEFTLFLSLKNKGGDDKVVGLVYESRNYDKFKFLDNNRDINQNEVKRFIKRIGEKELDTLIDVDEIYNILDGQHRFHARKQLNLPIIYRISEKIKKTDLSTLQQGNKWNVDAQLKNYIKLGYKDYILYKKLFDKYNDLKSFDKLNINHNELRTIFMGLDAYTKKISDSFNTGNMKQGRSEEYIYELLDWMFLSECLPNILSLEVLRNRYFQRALLALYIQENFDKKIFEKIFKKESNRGYIEGTIFRDMKADEKITKLVEYYNKTTRAKKKKLKI